MRHNLTIGNAARNQAACKGLTLGDGFLGRVHVAFFSRALLGVTTHVSGKFQCAARSEEAAVEHGQGECAGFGQLEACASERSEPRGLDLLLRRGVPGLRSRAGCRVPLRAAFLQRSRSRWLAPLSAIGLRC